MIVWIAEDICGNSEHEVVQRTAGIISSTAGLRCVGRFIRPTSENIARDSHNSDTSFSALAESDRNLMKSSSSASIDVESTPRLNYSLSRAELLLSIQSSLSTSALSPSLSELSRDTDIQVVESENLLFTTFFTVVRKWDPDFLLGYEMEKGSYGYLVRRGCEIEIDVLAALSRMPNEKASFRNRGVFQRAAELNRERIRSRERVLREKQRQATVPASCEHNDREIDTTVIEIDAHTHSSVDVPNYVQEPPRDGEDDANLFITGRTVLTCWEVMRSEVKLSQTTIQAVVLEVLKLSIPCFSPVQLTNWFRFSNKRFRTVQHYHMLTICNLLLIEKLDLFRKIAECARLYGIDFYSVLNRGSQYRVEASLLKKAHSLDFLLLSPSKFKVAAQAAMEVIPLVLEPQSAFYSDPVIVLDFQSLYPSMMIAYNLCYSTCMGKLRPGADADNPEHCVLGSDADQMDFDRQKEMDGETTGRLGVTMYPEAMSAIHASMHSRPPATQSTPINDLPESPETNPLDSQPYVTPNGVAFCARSIRHGILPQMVKEMLDTRVMVKRSMKRHCNGNKESQRVLQKVLDARQLAVKLLSNVTCKTLKIFLLFVWLANIKFISDGYTAAGFSGRMPMAELADAIVQSGRSTLEWTMNYIATNSKWQARVLYGDTDSVFVLLPGRSVAQAFEIGEEMAREVTAKQPPEVVLKFEKVYSPCLLVTKKRYVGRMFETMDEVHKNKGHLDAKGIEMIRRDQCPATKKIQEKTLRLLFETKDVSLVKRFLSTQFHRMLKSDLSLVRDCIFAKEVKFGQYATVSSLPPGAIVATKALLIDPMAAPPINWRVPYVVAQGPPGSPLKDLVFSPMDLLYRGSPLRLNAQYYLAKCIIPSLDRILSLCGIDVFSWFRSLPRPRVSIRHINYDVDKEVASSNSTIISLSGAPVRKTRAQQTTMDRFTAQSECELCKQDALPQKNLCADCLQQPMHSLVHLTQRLNLTVQREKQLERICSQCSGLHQGSELFVKREMIGRDACQSLSCQTFLERTRLVMRIEDFTMATRLAQTIDQI
jgi:DNA polymerase zeta